MQDIGDLAKMFGQMAAGSYKQKLSPVLDLMGHTVKAEVQKEIGEYQGPIGPFPATASLAPDTLYLKAERGHGKGGDPDTPLWATGEFHDSIQVAKHVETLSVEVGTDVPYVKYQELGTSTQPPRPVFGPSTLRAIPKILPDISQSAGNALGQAAGAWGHLGVEGITRAGGNDTGNILP
jgi:hypothetical protein